MRTRSPYRAVVTQGWSAVVVALLSSLLLSLRGPTIVTLTTATTIVSRRLDTFLFGLQLDAVDPSPKAAPCNKQYGARMVNSVRCKPSLESRTRTKTRKRIRRRDKTQLPKSFALSLL